MVKHLKSIARRVIIIMVDSATGLTAQAGKTVAVSISKNGAAWSSIGNATAIGDGAYYVDLTTTHTNTAGPLAIKATATDCAVWFDVMEIVDAELQDATLDAVAYTTWRQEIDSLKAATTYGDSLSTEADLLKSALGALIVLAGNSAISSGTITYKITSGGATQFTRTATVDANGNITSMT